MYLERPDVVNIESVEPLLEAVEGYLDRLFVRIPNSEQANQIYDDMYQDGLLALAQTYHSSDFTEELRTRL